MIIPNTKGKLRRNEEIDSKYVTLVEAYGEVIEPPKTEDRIDLIMPKGVNLVEIELRGDTSICGIFKEETAKFNVINMFKVADSVINMSKEKAGLLPLHMVEQFDFRKKVCKPCLDNGSCLVCGCETPGRLYSRTKCAGDKYPALLDKEEWEKFQNVL